MIKNEKAFAWGIVGIVLAVYMLIGNVMIGAEGRAEAPKMELTFLHAPGGKAAASPGYKGPVAGPTFWDALTAPYLRAHPSVTVRHIDVDLSTGSTLSMDALVASGQAPDVYFDAPMRTAKYMVPEFALALDGYATDWADYLPSVLDAVKRGGKIYAFPGWGWMTGMCLNLDLLAAAGASVPDDWTTGDFLVMAGKVKAKGKYATYLFAQDQSSDQWWMPWFAAFGARYYAPGDYSRSTLRSPQAVKALNFMKSLIDLGYVRPDAAATTDDDALADFQAGKVAAGSMQAAHIGTPSFKFRFVSFPHDTGVAGVGAAAGTSAAVVKASKDAERNKAAADLAWTITGKDALTYVGYFTPGSYPSRKSVTDIGGQTEFDRQIQVIATRNGVLDMGIASPKFTAVRGLMFPLLQQFYTGKMSAEDVMKTYEAIVNKELEAK